MLVVHQMLTTGYDVNRLKKMYLLRNAKEHTLLQTISRVNRPYKNPYGKLYRYGYIVDFVDIEEEYDRTIAMYLKELESEYGGADEDFTLTGAVIGPEDINTKYEKYVAELDDMIDTSNAERFSKQLTFMTKDALLTIRRLLNGIKTCYTEFKLSRAEQYSSKIDIDHIKKLLSLTQLRIGHINLKTEPTSYLSIISNEEVMEVIYQFIKTKVTVLDLSKLVEAMKKVTDSEGYKELGELVSGVQKEIRRNKNHNQIEMVKLDAVMQKLFDSLDISNITEVNEGLRGVLSEVKRINDENDRISERFGGSYAFVKTYTDAIEVHPNIDKEAIAKVLEVVNEAVQEISSANLLILQGRENFRANINKITTAKLIKSGLYDEAELDDWYDDLLYEIYANMKLF